MILVLEDKGSQISNNTCEVKVNSTAFGQAVLKFQSSFIPTKRSKN